MHRLFITALACLMSVSVFGQGWEQTYGGEGTDVGNSVQQTTDGGFIIAGTTSSFGYGEYDVYLIKTDENGIEQGSQTFGGEGYDSGNSVQQTTDGGFIIIGTTSSFGNGEYDVYLIKTDENGEEQWSQTFGGEDLENGQSGQQTIDGGYIIVGTTSSFGNGSGDVYLIKTDGNGLEEWSQTYGTSEEDVGESVQQTSDGGFIITGYTSSFGAIGGDVYLIKTDGIGDEQWMQTFGGTSEDMCYDVTETTDGGYIMCGYTKSFGAVGSDIYLIKTDGNGIEQWSQTFGGEGWEHGHSVEQTNDGGYIITGYTEESGLGQTIPLIKTDESGLEQWSQTYVGNGREVKLTTNGGYIITGKNGRSDLYLIKTDSEGTLSSSFTIATPAPRNLEKVVDALGRKTNHTRNQILFYIYDDGSVEKKFIVE